MCREKFSVFIHNGYRANLYKRTSFSFQYYSGMEQSGVLGGLITRRSLVQIQLPLFLLTFLEKKSVPLHS